MKKNDNFKSIKRNLNSFSYHFYECGIRYFYPCSCHALEKDKI